MASQIMSARMTASSLMLIIIPGASKKHGKYVNGVRRILRGVA